MPQLMRTHTVRDERITADGAPIQQIYEDNPKRKETALCL